MTHWDNYTRNFSLLNQLLLQSAPALKSANLFSQRPDKLEECFKGEPNEIVFSVCIARRLLTEGLTLTLVDKEDREIDIPIYFPEPKAIDTVNYNIDSILSSTNSIMRDDCFFDPNSFAFDLNTVMGEYILNEDDDSSLIIGDKDDYARFGDTYVVFPIKPFIPLPLFKTFYVWNKNIDCSSYFHFVLSIITDEPILDTGYEKQTHWGDYEPIDFQM